jgi:choline monooxygenase
MAQSPFAAPSRPARQLLHREAYFEAEWLAREETELFGRAWSFACMTDDLAGPGDYVTVKVGDWPLVILRDKGGALRAFHNVCRHRGMQVLEGCGNAAKGLTCPYHWWTYELDGALRGMPKREALFADLDLSTIALKPASVGVIDRLVFVCPDATPPDGFETFKADLEEHLWPHDVAKLEETASGRYRIACNSKLFAENAMDGYHLAYLHDRTLMGPDAEWQTWKAAGRHWVWYGPGESEGRRNSTMKRIPESDPDAPGPRVWWFFPTSGVIATGVFWSVFWLVPDGPQSCFLDTRTWIMPDQAEAMKAYEDLFPASRHRRDGSPDAIALDQLDVHPMETLDFQIEDMWVVERLQESLRSPAFEVGPLSLEASLTHFQRSILDYVPAGGRGMKAAAE